MFKLIKRYYFSEGFHEKEIAQIDCELEANIIVDLLNSRLNEVCKNRDIQKPEYRIEKLNYTEKNGFWVNFSSPSTQQIASK